MSMQSTGTVKSAGKRSAAKDDPVESKLAKLINDDDESEPIELGSGFLAEEIDPAEIELEVNSKELFNSWDNLERELDEPKSGEQFSAARIEYADEVLYRNDSAVKGDMYRDMEIEGDEDTDDEDLYYSKVKVGSVHEVEEDEEHAKNLELEAQRLEKVATQVTLPSSQSQNGNVSNVTDNVNVDQDPLVEDLGANFVPEQDVQMDENAEQPANNEDGAGNVADRADGADGANVANGAQEANGADGADGANGADGAQEANEEAEDVQDDLQDLRQNLYERRGKATKYEKNQQLTKKM